jgi:hypothetical protein
VNGPRDAQGMNRTCARGLGTFLPTYYLQANAASRRRVRQ